MDEVILSDNAKKEGKINLVSMIWLFVVALVILIGGIFLKHPLKQTVTFSIAFVLIACFWFYGFLYGMLYNLTVTKEQIRLKTLFRTVTINLSDIKEYSYKKYKRRSIFYQFKLRYLNKKIVITTRYCAEFDRILQNRRTDTAGIVQNG